MSMSSACLMTSGIGAVVPDDDECDTGAVVPEAADRREGELREAMSDGVVVVRGALGEMPGDEKRNVGAAVGVCRDVC